MQQIGENEKKSYLDMWQVQERLISCEQLEWERKQLRHTVGTGGTQNRRATRMGEKAA